MKPEERGMKHENQYRRVTQFCTEISFNDGDATGEQGGRSANETDGTVRPIDMMSSSIFPWNDSKMKKSVRQLATLAYFR